MILLDIGAFAQDAPAWLNMLINVSLLAGAGYLAFRALRSRESIFAAGFGLFALGQLLYISHHAGWSALLFVHLLGDSTVFVAFVLIFVGLIQHGIVRAETSHAHTDHQTQLPVAESEARRQ